MATNKDVAPSVWAPLHIAVFRAIWFAELAANIGTWFQNVGGVWLMTRFTTSPILIALMQTATSLPVLLGRRSHHSADRVLRRSERSSGLSPNYAGCPSHARKKWCFWLVTVTES